MTANDCTSMHANSPNTRMYIIGLYVVHVHLLHRINISSSKRLSDSDARSGLKTLPAMLNQRSTGADEAAMARYRDAILARCGHFNPLVHLYWRGSLVFSSGGWSRYSSTSDDSVVTGSSA